ncbi:MAG TPA: hypothetical protein VH682_21060 [Gemmataceae bacterium]
MTELKQLSADGRALSQTAVRLDTQLGAAVNALDQLTQEMKGFVAFKTTGENIIGWIKWFFGGSLAVVVTLLLAILAGVIAGVEIRSSVKWQGQRVEKLEEATVKLQESTAKLQETTSSNATAARTLAEKVEKNTNATKEIVADVEKELKALSPVKVVLVKTHEVTARFFLAHEAIRKTNKESVEFHWKLTHPIEKDKVEKTKVTARLASMGGGFEPTPGVANTDVQLRAGLAPDGQSCWVEIFSVHASKLAVSLKNSAKVPVDITFTIPD